MPLAPAADAVLLCAAVASLVSVGFVLVSAHGHSGSRARGALIGLAVATVTAAWAAVHTVFTFRYARPLLRRPGRWNRLSCR